MYLAVARLLWSLYFKTATGQQEYEKLVPGIDDTLNTREF